MAFLDELHARLAAEGRGLTPALVVEILAAEWGGQRVYIGVRGPAPVIDPRATVEQIRAAHGVSRSTAYNWVNGWRR